MNCGLLFTALVIFGGVASAQTFGVLYSFTNGGSEGSTLDGGPGRGSGRDPVRNGFRGRRLGVRRDRILPRSAGDGRGRVGSAGVVIGKNGTLYGTSGGGAGGFGTIFSLTPPSSQGGAWTHSVLHTFNGATDGCGPQAPLVFVANGTLYGTAVSGGSDGGGTVFSLTFP